MTKIKGYCRDCGEPSKEKLPHGICKRCQEVRVEDYENLYKTI